MTIDPPIRALYGPEVAWVWRTLLSGIGYAWREVPPGDPCDIAYVSQISDTPQARLIVRAEPQRWARLHQLRLAGIREHPEVTLPAYAGDAEMGELVQRSADQTIVTHDVVLDCFWLATGLEEAQLPKNKHGYVALEDTPYLRDAFLQRAIASGIGVWVQQLLQELGFPPPLPRWPHGRRAAACIGHDVDYPEVIRWLEPARVLMRQGARGMHAALSVLLGRRHHWHFESWMQLEQQLGTRSAFYFVARKGSLIEYALQTPDSFYDIRTPRFRALFARLREQGFEIGLHASYRAYANPEQFAAEKQLVEAMSGGEVVGNRHHYWHMHPDTPEATLLLHGQLGFSYDASLTHDRYLGWRRGMCWPFFPFHRQQRQEVGTLQINTAWMDAQLFLRTHMTTAVRQDLLRSLADRTLAQGGCLMVDVHDYVFDGVLFPGWTAAFQGLWEYVADSGAFWMETPARIAAYWRERHTTIMRASTGLEGA